MTKPTWILCSILVNVLLWTASGRALAVGDPADPHAGWAIRTDALLLWRDGPNAAPLFLDAATDATALSSADAAAAMAAGPRYALFWSPDGIRSVEANYFRVQSWQGTAAASGALEQNDVYGFNFAGIDSAAITSTSGIQSFELNGRRRLGDRVTWLAGFRWVEWNDSLGIVDTAGSDQDIFSTQTIDNLYGGQVGLDTVMLRQGSLRLEGLGKAGVYYDHAAGQRSSVTSTSFPAASNAASTDRVAFVGEIGVTGVWEMADWLLLRAGYTVFWLGNVTSAASQVQANDLFSQQPATIVGGDSVFLNGITLGLEARF